MLNCFIESTGISQSIPIIPCAADQFTSWLTEQDEFTRNWLNATGYKPEGNNNCLIPTANGTLAKVLINLNDNNDFWGLGRLPHSLPEGFYDLSLVSDERIVKSSILAWGLGAYKFNRYKKSKRNPAKLVVSRNDNFHSLQGIIEAIYLVRDLINTPTENMRPSDLAETAIALARKFSADALQIVGDELLTQNFPAIHAVGRASDNAPRLIDLRWGDRENPQLTLVGKGVCFDTGGLDIKPAASMILMKKDMAGAAHVLGLAYLIMSAQLPVRLRVLIPCVENSIAGNAYRPGDIIPTRKGLTIEVGNTDAEGRVVLADALAEAACESPDLIIDFTTLTGAAKIALGTDLPALFCNNDEIAKNVLHYSQIENDPVWQLPLYQGYREQINSSFADLNNNGSMGYGGAITAALFLQEFINADIPWIHIDNMAWNFSDRPGRPLGGEAMGLRAIFGFLKNRYLKQ